MPVGTCITKCVDVSDESVFRSVSATGYDLTKHASLQDVINFLTDDGNEKANRHI